MSSESILTIYLLLTISIPWFNRYDKPRLCLLRTTFILESIICFIRFNNKTEKNSLMIKHIEKDIEHVKEETKIVFAKLEVKIGDLEDDVKSIASDIAEIKGFIKQLSLSK